MQYANYIDSFRTHLRSAFYAHVMSQVGEKLWIECADKRFATTLYNYDLAGNLIQTVPPEGVHKLGASVLAAVDALRDADSVSAAVLPAHTKVTRYEYNTVNRPVTESTPDAGLKSLYYDAKGNVIASQTARQRAAGTFTYMLYDRQNRLTETGEVHWTGSCAGFADQPSWVRSGSSWTRVPSPSSCACESLRDSTWRYCINSILDPYLRIDDNTVLAAAIHAMGRSQVVVNIYDSAARDLGLCEGMSRQQNLRSRIGASLYYEGVSGQNFTTGYTHATHYSYDVSGNVQTLTQDFPELEGVQQRYKRIDYEYDLLSGKVNMIAYNRGGSDQLYQRYSYDADNRIVRAETSHDGIIWKRDAEYSYYKHGPLARVSIGDQRVQGIDYAYTLQGWLKKINSDYADGQSDMGGDAVTPGSVTPRDAMRPISATSRGTIRRSAVGCR